MRSKLVLIVLVLCVGAQAQMVDVKSKDGFFMGQRIAVTANAMVQPIIAGRIDNDRFMEFPGISPRLDATYALNNGSSIKLFTSFSFIERQKSAFFYLDGGSNRYKEVGENPKIQSTNIGLQYNFHFKSKGALAPAGAYFGFGLGVRSATATHEGVELGNYGSGWDLHSTIDKGYTEASQLSLLFTMEYAHRFPISDQMFWEIGVTNLWTTDFVKGLQDFDYNYEDYDDYDEVQSVLLRNRIGTWDFLRLGLGVGMFL